MAAHDWQDSLECGDPVEADHPIDGRRIQGTFIVCRGDRFCEIESDGSEYVVSYKGLIRR